MPVDQPGQGNLLPRLMVLVIICCALLGWSLLRPFFHPDPPPSPPVPPAPPPKHSDVEQILGKYYTAQNIQNMYQKVKDKYLVSNGQCYHTWQRKSGQPLDYDEFVKFLKAGFYFPEISEPGEGDKVILNYKSRLGPAEQTR